MESWISSGPYFSDESPRGKAVEKRKHDYLSEESDCEELAAEMELQEILQYYDSNEDSDFMPDVRSL